MRPTPHPGTGILPAIRTWVGGLLLAISALALAATGAQAQTAGGIGFRIDGSPGSTLDGGFVVLTIPAGSTGTGHFFISNGQTFGVRLALYPADGLTGVTTGVVYGDAGDTISGAGAWVTPSTRSAYVGASSEQQVDFSVAVPAGTTPGDHVGSVVFEQTRPGSKVTGTVSQVVRSVVPILIEVPGAASPQVIVKTASIDTLPGSTLPAITVGLKNIGEKMCQPLLTVGLTGPGDGDTEVSRQLDTILPGDTAPYPLPWPQNIKAGSHLVKVTAEGCGRPRSIGVTVKYVPPVTSTLGGTTGGTSGGGKGPGKVVTDAAPGKTTYKAGPGDETAAKKRKKKAGPTPTPAIALAPGAKSPGSGSGVSAAKGSGGGGFGGAIGGFLKNAGKAIAANAKPVAERATGPLALLGLIGLLFFAQEAIDRKDPKLALAPLHRDQDLAFDPDPPTARRVVPRAGAAPS